MLIGDEKVKVYDSIVVDKKHNFECGKIYLGEKSRVFVACGNNTVLELLSVQPSGKKVMSARDFANGALRKYL